MDESTCNQCGGRMSVVPLAGLCPACFAVKGLVSNTQNRAARRVSDWTPPLPSDISLLFPDIDRIELIGRGGMGAVYKGRQKRLDRTVALKILPPQLLHDATFAERFSREAQAMARLNHPNIITIHDFGRRGELFYFIMEFVDGLTLRQLISRGRISGEEALAIVPQICDALQYAHEHGIVHRDIKPENLLLSRRGQVKIADFGLAKLVGAEIEGAVPVLATQTAVGTPLYMAPEQISSPATVDHRADVYSLGVVMYELLTGELPDGDFEPLQQRASSDPRLDELVGRALRQDPAQRFASVFELRTQLDTLASIPRTINITTPTPFSPLPEPTTPPVESARRSDTQKLVQKDVRALIAVPARGIRYVAIANMVFLVVTTVPALISFVAAAPERVMDNPLGLHLTLPWWATGAFIYTVLSVALNAMVFLGARRMAEVRSYGWSMASAILCLFAAPANVVGAVFGVWALMVLSRSQTRQAFGVQEPDTQPPPARGLTWMPMIRMHAGEKRVDLVNYTLLSSGVWLLSDALVSVLLLGKPMHWLWALLLVLPAIAVAQSLTRYHRRLAPAVLEQGARRPWHIASRLAAFAALVLLHAATQQYLAVRHLAEARAAATQPAKSSVVDRLHLTVPKVPR